MLEPLSRIVIEALWDRKQLFSCRTRALKVGLLCECGQVEAQARK
jgi:hypothetical protein